MQFESDSEYSLNEDIIRSTNDIQGFLQKIRREFSDRDIVTKGFNSLQFIADKALGSTFETTFEDVVKNRKLLDELMKVVVEENERSIQTNFASFSDIFTQLNNTRLNISQYSLFLSNSQHPLEVNARKESKDKNLHNELKHLNEKLIMDEEHLQELVEIRDFLTVFNKIEDQINTNAFYPAAKSLIDCMNYQRQYRALQNDKIDAMLRGVKSKLSFKIRMLLLEMCFFKNEVSVKAVNKPVPQFEVLFDRKTFELDFRIMQDDVFFKIFEISFAICMLDIEKEFLKNLMSENTRKDILKLVKDFYTALINSFLKDKSVNLESNNLKPDKEQFDLIVSIFNQYCYHLLICLRKWYFFFDMIKKSIDFLHAGTFEIPNLRDDFTKLQTKSLQTASTMVYDCIQESTVNMLKLFLTGTDRNSTRTKHGSHISFNIMTGGESLMRIVQKLDEKNQSNSSPDLSGHSRGLRGVPNSPYFLIALHTRCMSFRRAGYSILRLKPKSDPIKSSLNDFKTTLVTVMQANLFEQHQSLVDDDTITEVEGKKHFRSFFSKIFVGINQDFINFPSLSQVLKPILLSYENSFVSDINRALRTILANKYAFKINNRKHFNVPKKLAKIFGQLSDYSFIGSVIDSVSFFNLSAFRGIDNPTRNIHTEKEVRQELALYWEKNGMLCNALEVQKPTLEAIKLMCSVLQGLIILSEQCLEISSKYMLQIPNLSLGMLGPMSSINQELKSRRSGGSMASRSEYSKSNKHKEHVLDIDNVSFLNQEYLPLAVTKMVEEHVEAYEYSEAQQHLSMLAEKTCENFFSLFVQIFNNLVHEIRSKVFFLVLELQNVTDLDACIFDFNSFCIGLLHTLVSYLGEDFGAIIIKPIPQLLDLLLVELMGKKERYNREFIAKMNNGIGILSQGLDSVFFSLHLPTVNHLPNATKAWKLVTYSYEEFKQQLINHKHLFTKQSYKYLISYGFKNHEAELLEILEG
ncbi:hypothetical protein PCE1_003619 [Barthelona sp. PCE]